MKDNGSRLRNIFIIGTICYIILHAYLFAQNAGETTMRFRHYLYYLFLADAILTGAYVWLFGTRMPQLDCDTDEHDANERNANERNANERNANERNANERHVADNDKPKQSPHGKQPDNHHGGQNMADLHRKLLELKAQQELKLKQGDTRTGHPVSHTGGSTQHPPDGLGLSGSANRNADKGNNESPFAKKDMMKSSILII